MNNLIPNKIVLFIPCYNEAKRIQIEQFSRFISDYKTSIDFYFINDGSTDDTKKLIDRYLINKVNAFLINLDRNHGKGNALRKGILSIKLYNYSYLAFIDADMDIPLKQILNLYQELEGTEKKIAISNRSFYSEFNFFRFRSYLSLAMVYLANLIIGYDFYIKDTQCGCKMFRWEIAEICFDEPFVSEWLFDIEIFLRFKKAYNNSRGLIAEVPLKINHDNSKSHSKLFSAPKILFQLNKIRRNYR